MVNQYLGEVKLVSFGFAPKGWTQCIGSLLSIQQNTALFSLLGTFYGGNGTSNFGLPDLRGRVVAGQGSTYAIGEQTGTESVTLLSQQLPAHIHPFAVNTTGGLGLPTNNFLASVGATSPPPASAGQIYAAPGTLQPLNPASIALSGGSNQPHENRQPYLAMTYTIALVGIFPSRN